MKRKYLILIGMLLLTLALAAGCGQPGKADASKDGPVPVSTVQAVKGTLDDNAVISGKLEAVESAALVPKISGRAAKIPVDIGSKVSEGDLLLALDAQDMSAAVSQARAALARAKADAAMANKSYDRMKTLFEQGAVSTQEMDLADQSRQTAGAAVAQSQAAVEAAQAAYDNSVITAPISGVVTARDINPGELASPGSPVLKINNLDTVMVRASVEEEQINTLKQGQKAAVRVSSVSEEPFQGIITNIGLAADEVTKSYPIKIQIKNKDHVLKPGMFADVLLEGGSKKELLIPKAAVVSEGAENYVFTIDKEQAEKRKVTLGRSDGENIVVKTGLKEKEQVVVDGQEALQDGTEVKLHND